MVIIAGSIAGVIALVAALRRRRRTTVDLSPVHPVAGAFARYPGRLRGGGL